MTNKINNIHLFLLEILAFFDAFCMKNNLRYFLTGGTLYGVATQKGFCDGDDDIDVGMLREDYESFLLLFSKNNTDNNFELINYKTAPDCCILYTKLVLKGVKMGDKCISIDVYPFDKAPFHFFQKSMQLFKKKYYSAILFSKYKKKHSVLLFLASIFGLFYRNKNAIYAKAEKNLTKYDKKVALENVCGLEGGHGFKESLPLCDVLNTQKEMFEGRLFFVPNNYASFVKRIYGQTGRNQKAKNKHFNDYDKFDSGGYVLKYVKL